jgi:hypothetical protein
VIVRPKEKAALLLLLRYLTATYLLACEVATERTKSNTNSDGLQIRVPVVKCNALHQGSPKKGREVGESVHLIVKCNVLHQGSPKKKREVVESLCASYRRWDYTYCAWYVASRDTDLVK